MQFIRNRFYIFYYIISITSISCNEQIHKINTNNSDFGTRCIPLITTRFKDLEHLKSVVNITYDRDYSNLDSSEYKNSSVRLIYTSNGEKIDRTLHSGTKQSDLQKIQKAEFFSKLNFLFNNPYAVRERKALELFHIISRRRADIFGSKDVAFFDLAETTFRHINTPELAYQSSRDSSEKGFTNTFNHITAQAIITSFFSEELGDLIGDLHERLYMPELTTGMFRVSQLTDTINSPLDNYVDVINNEIGQIIGNELKIKYGLNKNKSCNAVLLSNYLNDVQSYYMWSIGIGMDPYSPNDEVIKKFSKKLNKLLIKY